MNECDKMWRNFDQEKQYFFQFKPTDNHMRTFEKLYFSEKLNLVLSTFNQVTIELFHNENSFSQYFRWLMIINLSLKRLETKWTQYNIIKIKRSVKRILKKKYTIHSKIFIWGGDSLAAPPQKKPPVLSNAKVYSGTATQISTRTRVVITCYYNLIIVLRFIRSFNDPKK